MILIYLGTRGVDDRFPQRSWRVVATQQQQETRLTWVSEGSHGTGDCSQVISTLTPGGVG